MTLDILFKNLMTSYNDVDPFFKKTQTTTTTGLHPYTLYYNHTLQYSPYEYDTSTKPYLIVPNKEIASNSAHSLLALTKKRDILLQNWTLFCNAIHSIPYFEGVTIFLTFKSYTSDPSKPHSIILELNNQIIEHQNYTEHKTDDEFAKSLLQFETVCSHLLKIQTGPFITWADKNSSAHIQARSPEEALFIFNLMDSPKLSGYGYDLFDPYYVVEKKAIKAKFKTLFENVKKEME
jgi:hypothetical protein